MKSFRWLKRRDDSPINIPLSSCTQFWNFCGFKIISFSWYRNDFSLASPISSFARENQFPTFFFFSNTSDVNRRFFIYFFLSKWTFVRATVSQLNLASKLKFTQKCEMKCNARPKDKTIVIQNAASLDAKDRCRFCSKLLSFFLSFLSNPQILYRARKGLRWRSECVVCVQKKGRKGPIVLPLSQKEKKLSKRKKTLKKKKNSQKDRSRTLSGLYVYTHWRQGLRSRWLLTGKFSSEKKNFLPSLFSRSEIDNVCKEMIFRRKINIYFLQNLLLMFGRGFDVKKMFEFFEKKFKERNNVWFAKESQTDFWNSANIWHCSASPFNRVKFFSNRNFNDWTSEGVSFECSEELCR